MAQDIREFISNVGRTSEIVIKLCRAVMSLGGGLEDIKILLQEKHDEDFVKMAKILLGMADIEEYTSDHVALHARCSEIRLRAIKEVSSESTLATIATTDPIKEIRRAAIKRIKNEDILFDVVSKGYNGMPDRIAAHGVERIQNQKHLLQIASTHGSLWVRDPAVKRLDGDHTKELLDMELIDDRESFSAIVFLWAHIRFPDFAFESEHL